jgi:hypothetical protein
MRIRSIKTGQYSHKFTKVRLFVFHSKETIIENVIGRRKRNVTLYREVLLPQVFKKLKLPPNIRASWSQKAGCSCGCSPGFILDTLPLRRGYDAIYVKVS